MASFDFRYFCDAQELATSKAMWVFAQLPRYGVRGREAEFFLPRKPQSYVPRRAVSVTKKVFFENFYCGTVSVRTGGLVTAMSRNPMADAISVAVTVLSSGYLAAR